MLVLLIRIASTLTSRRGRNQSRAKNKEERMTAKVDSLDVRTIFVHRQPVSMESIVGIMKRFYCRERMFTARSQPPGNKVILYRISRDGVLQNYWSPITKDVRLQEPNFVFSNEAAVPRFDTLTSRFVSVPNRGSST